MASGEHGVNGSTPVSKTVSEGSNPSAPAIICILELAKMLVFLFFTYMFFKEIHRSRWLWVS